MSVHMASSTRSSCAARASHLRSEASAPERPAAHPARRDVGDHAVAALRLENERSFGDARAQLQRARPCLRAIAELPKLTFGLVELEVQHQLVGRPSHAAVCSRGPRHSRQSEWLRATARRRAVHRPLVRATVRPCPHRAWHSRTSRVRVHRKRARRPWAAAQVFGQGLPGARMDRQVHVADLSRSQRQKAHAFSRSRRTSWTDASPSNRKAPRHLGHSPMHPVPSGACCTTGNKASTCSVVTARA